MGILSFKEITTNLTGLIQYDRSLGKYGLLKDGKIIKIELWSKTIEPQELHFPKPFLKQLRAISKSSWAYSTDFLAFSDNKRLLKKFRKVLKKTHLI